MTGTGINMEEVCYYKCRDCGKKYLTYPPHSCQSCGATTFHLVLGEDSWQHGNLILRTIER